MRFEPQCAGRGGRIHPDVQPPGGFIATMMNFAMVSATQWDGEFVTNLSPECSGLRKSEMVGIRGSPAADQTRVLGDGFDVRPVANPPRLRQCQYALIDLLESLWLSCIATKGFQRPRRRHLGLIRVTCCRKGR
jgi:hypothetical protein